MALDRSRNKYFLFPLCFVIYEAASYMASDAYVPALIDFIHAFNTTAHQAYLSMTLFFLGSVLFQFIVGPLSMRFGRRPILLIGGYIFVFSLLICAFTKNLELFQVARFIQGACISPLTITGYATIHSMFEQIKAIKTLAWMSIITVLAPALAPLFGASVLLIANWRWIFVILAIWVFVILIALYKYMPETSTEKSQKLNISQSIWHYGSLMSNWQFMQPILSLSLLFAILTAWLVCGSLMVVDHFHQSIMVFAFIQLFIFSGFIAGTRLTNYLIDQITLRAVSVIVIFLVACSGCLALLFGLLFNMYLWSLIIPLTLLTIAAGTGLPIYNRMVAENASEPMDLKMALLSFFMGLGCLAGSVLINLFYTKPIDFYLMFSILAFIFVVINASIPKAHHG